MSKNLTLCMCLPPPQYHAELSIMAMNRGCHVLVEKPLALSMADADKMVKVAEQNKVCLCVDHNLVFEDIVQRAMELNSRGVLGELVSVEACVAYNARRNPGVLEEGAEYCHWSYQLNGGLLQDWMPHPASLVMEFIPEIQEIQWIAHNRGVLPKGWQDEIRVLVKSTSVTGYISISLSERPDTILLILKGTKGTAQANLFSHVLTLQTRSSLPRAVARGLSGFQLALQNLGGALENMYKFTTGRVDTSNGIGQVVSRFYESIRSEGEMPISLHNALRVVKLMDRIWPAPAVDANKTIPILRSSKRKPIVPTALVTGGSGFIGTHLIKRLLSENVGVRVLVRPNSIHAGRLHKFDIDIVQGDLADAETVCEATRGISTIYHLGAAMGGGWEQHYQSTIRGTEHLIEAALAHQVKRFVHLSTLAVYDLLSIRDGAIVKEETSYQKHPRRMGPYVFSKIEAEKLVLNAFRRQGLGVTVIRPGIVIGSLGRVFFPHLGYRYRDRLFLLIGKGTIILPLTYVENTVDGIYKASVEHKAVGQVYNLVDDGEITVREYLEHFSRVTGIQARIICLPYIIPYLATTAYEIAGHFDLVRKEATSRAQLKWKQAPVRFDNAKARNELGWNPDVSIEEGLTRTFEWYAGQYRDCA